MFSALVRAHLEFNFGSQVSGRTWTSKEMEVGPDEDQLKEMGKFILGKTRLGDR